MKEMDGACSKYEGEMCTCLVGKAEGKQLLARPRRRWECNNKMVLQGEVWGRGLKLSALGQGKVVCACDCDKGNSGSIKR